MTKKTYKDLPLLPGIYLFKDKDGSIIYVGKATCLKERVQSYFSKSMIHDWKTAALMNEYADIDYIVTHSDIAALRLEADLIQKYQPKYNILLKEGQPFLYILFTPGTAKKLPSCELVRTKRKVGKYFGPFLVKKDARLTYHFLTRTFQLIPCNKKIPAGCLNYHLGNCPGTCRPDFDRENFELRMHLACTVLENDRSAFISLIDKRIKQLSHAYKFEEAQKLLTYKTSIENIFTALKKHNTLDHYATDLLMITTPAPWETKIIHEEKAAYDIKKLLHLDRPAFIIDCFDISHFQSAALVGSCIRFIRGKPSPSHFRRFALKTVTVQNDYAALAEIVQRRYAHHDYPDLILIDGGKGQLNTILALNLPVACASLAKREEIVYGTKIPSGIHLDLHTESGKLLIALRDYAHHFACSYHRLKRSKKL